MNPTLQRKALMMKKMIEMATNEEIDSKKRIIARYLNGDAYLQEGTTTASSVLQLVDQIEDLARAEGRQRLIKILNDLRDKEAGNIDNGVYFYPFEAMRDMILKALNKVD